MKRRPDTALAGDLIRDNAREKIPRCFSCLSKLLPQFSILREVLAYYYSTSSRYLFAAATITQPNQLIGIDRMMTEFRNSKLAKAREIRDLGNYGKALALLSRNRD